MEIGLVIPAFIAGLLMFFAPCTLPLAPAYLGFLSGISANDVLDPKKPRSMRIKIFLRGLSFVIGFSCIFILSGALAGYVGGMFNPYRLWFMRIGGIVVIVFGLFMLKILPIPFLYGEKKFRIPQWMMRGSYITAFVFGATFAIGWTPCIGPILGTVLLIAATSGKMLSGIFLLFIFSLGFSIPFLILAWSIATLARFLQKVSRFLSVISYIGGVFLIILGILLLTDNFEILINYGYRMLYFINYDAIINYL